MNKVLLSYVGLLCAISGCASSPAVSTHDAVSGSPAVQPAAHEELRNFNIGAGYAPTTLNQFAQQANEQVLFDFNVVQHRQTQAVEGTLKPSEALWRMLNGTGLVADNVNDLTVAVTPTHRSL